MRAVWLFIGRCEAHDPSLFGCWLWRDHKGKTRCEGQSAGAHYGHDQVVEYHTEGRKEKVRLTKPLYCYTCQPDPRIPEQRRGGFTRP
jgi:hypothetical protein